MQAEHRADEPGGPRLDAVALVRAATRLAATGAVPWLHGEAARRMAERLPLVKLQPQRVLDWSGPLGGSEELLRQAYPQARQQWVQVDGLPPVAPRPVGAARWWPWRRAGREALAAADAEPGAAQLLWSNMLLQACDDPAPLLGQWQRVLATGGFLMFSTLGPGSLPELRDLYREQGWGEPMVPFIDMHDLGDLLVRAGFADPVMDQEQLTLTWPDAQALLSELRGLGANLSPRRHAGLRTPRWRQRLLAALAAKAVDGRPRLSFELVYGHAFKAAPRTAVQAEARVSLEDMRTQLRQGKLPPT